MDIKTKIPWWGKIVAKLVLSRLPLRYDFWRRLSLFKHGQMHQPMVAYKAFKKCFDRVSFPRSGEGGGFVALELGPGDSLFSGMIAVAFKASATYLVDVGSFAVDDMKFYRAMADFLEREGLSAPKMEELTSLQELLLACSTHYLTSGLSSLRTISDSSVDFIWSNAVLEHVRRKEFFDTMVELRRIIRDDGVCIHGIDLKDHLGGDLNNLRFSEAFWEWDFVADAGFYTNRIRFSEMVDFFRQAGFSVEVLDIKRWNELPTPRKKLFANFEELPDEELCVASFEVILRPV